MEGEEGYSKWQPDLGNGQREPELAQNDVDVFNEKSGILEDYEQQ